MWHLFQNIFTEEQCSIIIKECEKYSPQEASTFNHDSKWRESTIRWVNQEKGVRDKLFEYVVEANRRIFGCDVHNCTDLQFTEYHATTNGHYDWHIDSNEHDGRAYVRKLSVVLQLDKPHDYQGGNFEFMEGQPLPEEAKNQGSLIVFPSYKMHRVTPVTVGMRRSIVAWFEGPRWK